MTPDKQQRLLDLYSRWEGYISVAVYWKNPSAETLRNCRMEEPQLGNRVGSPFVIHNKFERMFPSLQVVDVCEIVTGSVHRNLSRPSIEGTRDIDLTSTVFPAKDSWNGVVIQPILNARRIP